MVTIASVPVALPAVLSVTMAVGARQLARRQAVVSHLPAVEELGGIDVLCSDKTGTLTQNRLAVGSPWTAPGVAADDCSPRPRSPPAPRTATRSTWPCSPPRPPRRPACRVERVHPVRPGRQAHRGHGHGAGGEPVPGQQGRPAGDRRPVRRRPRRRAGSARDGGGLRRPRLPLPRRGPRRRRRAVAAARRAAAGRPAAGGLRRPPSPPPASWACDVKMVTGDQVAIGREIAAPGRPRHRHPATPPIARGDRGRGRRTPRRRWPTPGRGRRRLRPGVPRAQVPDRARAAGPRPHRRA